MIESYFRISLILHTLAESNEKCVAHRSGYTNKSKQRPQEIECCAKKEKLLSYIGKTYLPAFEAKTTTPTKKHKNFDNCNNSTATWKIVDDDTFTWIARVHIIEMRRENEKILSQIVVEMRCMSEICRLHRYRISFAKNDTYSFSSELA